LTLEEIRNYKPTKEERKEMEFLLNINCFYGV